MSKRVLSIDDLPESLDAQTVAKLRAIEAEQSPAWKDLFGKMSFQQKRDYGKLKGAQQKLESHKEKASWSFDDWCAHEFTMNNFIAARQSMPLAENEIATKVRQRTQTGEEQFHFFWETKSPFSQWHKASFSGPVYLWDNDFAKQLLQQGYPVNRLFHSAEQCMMYQKAMLFLDLEVAEEIMQTQNNRKIKDLGRQVKRFNNDTWTVFRWDIVYLANRLKFSQNPNLKDALLATQGTTLVEASPYDAIWGIGLEESDPRAKKRASWQGKNLLGEILTELRVAFTGSY